ncbi:hypothetical protein PTTW11_10365 [Pyrenophora teres f. teres]|uniref:Uncharacterized protein n=1 Tax=Pyrenophora teres f. teres TaxID=97479 RepID=A0A6S6WFP5_9PLEO|nr:hypothetical protein PTTW11_10365 [Pyrenophora teres f. teres]
MGGRRDSGTHTPNAPCTLHLLHPCTFCTLARLALEQGPPERPRQIAPRSQPGLSTALWPIRPRAVGPAAAASVSHQSLRRSWPPPPVSPVGPHAVLPVTWAEADRRDHVPSWQAVMDQKPASACAATDAHGL